MKVTPTDDLKHLGSFQILTDEQADKAAWAVIIGIFVMEILWR